MQGPGMELEDMPSTGLFTVAVKYLALLKSPPPSEIQRGPNRDVSISVPIFGANRIQPFWRHGMGLFTVLLLMELLVIMALRLFLDISYLVFHFIHHMGIRV